MLYTILNSICLINVRDVKHDDGTFTVISLQLYLTQSIIDVLCEIKF